MQFEEQLGSLKQSLTVARVKDCARPYVRVTNGAFAGAFFGMAYGIVFGVLYAVIGTIIFTPGFSELSDLKIFWLQSARLVAMAMMFGALIVGVLGGIYAMRNKA